MARVKVGSRHAKARFERNSKPGRRSVRWRNGWAEVTPLVEPYNGPMPQTFQIYGSASLTGGAVWLNNSTTYTTPIYFGANYSNYDYDNQGYYTVAQPYNYVVPTINQSYYGTWPVLVPETEEARVARLEREKIEFDRQATIKKRALRLLKGLLSVSQWAEFKETLAVMLTTPAGHKFRLKFGSVGNVERLDDKGDVLKRYCIAPKDAYSLPTEDVLASQVLGLMTDEPGYLSKANVVYDSSAQVESQYTFMGNFNSAVSLAS